MILRKINQIKFIFFFLKEPLITLIFNSIFTFKVILLYIITVIGFFLYPFLIKPISATVAIILFFSTLFDIFQIYQIINCSLICSIYFLVYYLCSSFFYFNNFIMILTATLLASIFPIFFRNHLIHLNVLRWSNTILLKCFNNRLDWKIVRIICRRLFLDLDYFAFLRWLRLNSWLFLFILWANSLCSCAMDLFIS